MKEPRFLDDAFSFVCRQLLQIFLKKHKDYGKSNILDSGEMGILFRVSDKINRLKHLIGNHKKPDNESMDDNWLDIGVYAVIAILYRRGWFNTSFALSQHLLRLKDETFYLLKRSILFFPPGYKPAVFSPVFI